MLRSPTPRSFAVAALLAATLAISCGPDITGPSHGVRYARGITFQPVFPALAALASDAGLVPFTTVHIVLHHADGTIALDTIVNFPADASELTLSLNVPLAANAPPTGEPLSLNLAYVNAEGVTVFEGGPFPIIAVPSVEGAPPPPPVSVPVSYTGPGSTATSVVITPHTSSVLSGDAFGFSATAFDASGAPLPGTPIVFSSSNAALAPLSSPSSGGGTAAVGRGAVTITAQLLTGPTDAATLTIQPRPSAIAAVSGSGQTAQVGAAVPLPAIVRVTATDGLGVSGVTVSFGASSGGSASPTSAVTASDGTAQAGWTLGNTAGGQTLSASVTGVSGSPVTFTATATPKPPVKLVFGSQPASAAVNASIGTVSVAAQDASNNLSTTFTGTISIGLGANPGGGSLAGVTTATAVGGVATFSGLGVNKTGLGYTLTASSSGLTGATSSSFDITAGAPTHVEFSAQPGSAVAGAVLGTVTVTVRDIANNVANTFTGPISVGISSNPGGATLSGTATVNAVAGVATFSNLSLNKTGQNYTLIAGGTGLGSEVSSGFNITAGPPALCTVANGNNQTSPAGTTISVAIQVSDALGNGVAGGGVGGVITLGGGTLVPPSATADQFGVATFAWTLGPTLGTQSFTATCSGVAGGVSVSATAISGVAGPATQLAFSVQPSTVTAGIPNTPSIQVTAKDAVGLTATTFTGNITLTLGTNPGGSTLGGTLVVPAVAGVATFANIRLNKIGAGYTLNAAAVTLTGTTSVGFTVIAAPAVTIVADSGDGQSAPISTLLPAKIVARVLDSLANPVAGTNVTLAIASGGGTLVPAGVVATDANGRVRTNWTLGATGGAQTATATSVGLAGSPVTFTATGTGGPLSIVWTGAVDSLWSNAANWNPAQVPTIVDSVTIPSVGFQPLILTPANVHHLVMPGCNSMINNSTLTISGHYIDNSSFCLRAAPTRGTRLAHYVFGSGTIILTGNGNIMGGLGGTGGVQVTGGIHTMTNQVFVNSDLAISGGTFNTNGNMLQVSNNFSTSGTGVLQMQSPSSLLIIFGNATWGGGSETGQLTDGTIQVQGNFTASATKFDATGTQQLELNGCGATQTLDFTAPVAGKGIRNLNITCNSPIVITGAPTVTGNVVINGSSPGVSGPATVTVMGNLTDVSGAVGGGWRVANTVMNSNGQIQGFLFSTNFTIVGGTVTLENDGFTQLNGNFTVTGASSVLDMNGGTLFMAGNFATSGGGKLKMTDVNDLDYLLIAGNATFAGGSTTGLITHGFMQVEGNFTQGGGATDAFAASGTHQTTLGTQFFDGPFLRAPARARTASQRAGATPARLPRQIMSDARPLAVPAGLSSAAAKASARAHERMAHARALATTDRAMQVRAPIRTSRAPLATNARAAARAAASARVMARLNASPAASVVKTSMSKVLMARMVLPMTVNFANPGTGAGTSHFATGVLSTEELDLASDVFMNGQLYADDDVHHLIAGSNNVLTSRGASVFDFEFESVRWVLLDGDAVFSLSDVIFEGMDPTVNQFTIQRTGTGPTGSIQPLFDFTFDTPPTSGNYISATDTDGAVPDVLFIDMAAPVPGTSGGFIQLLNGATTNWMSSFIWMGGGTTDSWSDAGNWNTESVPTSFDDVLIPAAALTSPNPHPRLQADALVHSLTIESGQLVDLNCSTWTLVIFGNLTGPIGQNTIPTCEGEGIALLGDGATRTATGYFGVVDFLAGNYNVAGQLIVSDYLGVVDGNLNVNGGRIDVGNVGGTANAFFFTEGTGTLTMQNVADVMYVGSGGSYWEGGNTTGLLTAGTINLINSCVHTMPGIGDIAAFAPSGSHNTVFGGSSSNVEFADPASFLNHAELPGLAEMVINANVTVNGTLSHTGTGTAAITGGAPGVLTLHGLNSTQPMIVQNQPIVVANSALPLVFDNVTWNFFPLSYTGNVFDVTRNSAGPFTFTNHNFSTISLGVGGHWLVNRGTANIHMATPTPGIVTTQVLQIGTGLIIWP